jgi:threonine/homoserine/homoserine lactone efflux protein
MMSLVGVLAAFVGAAFLVAMVPGPSTVMIVRASVRSGRAAGAMTMLGNEAGVLLWGMAAAFGLSALLVASRVAYDGLRLAGAAVLVWFGVRALWHNRRRAPAAAEAAPEDAGPAGPERVSRWRLFRLGLVTNLANPKAGVFAVSFLPQFVPHGLPVPVALVALSLLWVVIDGVWYAGVIWLAGRARKALGSPRVRARMERVSGLVLIGLGVRLAAESA